MKITAKNLEKKKRQDHALYPKIALLSFDPIPRLAVIFSLILLLR